MSPLVVSSSPHIRHPDSTRKIMWSVVIALLPALIASAWFFGWRAWFVTGLSVGTAVIAEALCQWYRKVPVTVGDGSAVITGILLAFCLPPTVRWFVPVVASAAAIIIAKQAFGGLGWNIWNPALVGRAIVHNSFLADMNPTNYPVIAGSGNLANFFRDFWSHLRTDVGATYSATASADAITSASPMAVLKSGLYLDPLKNGVQSTVDAFSATFGKVGLWDAFVGSVGGNLGETSALLLLIGAAFLAIRGYIRWYVPVLYVGTVALLVSVLPLPVGPAESRWVWFAAFSSGSALGWQFIAYHLFCGGLMLGALYMATDMVTSPMTRKGLIIFAIGCGVLTSLIRLYGGYPEGVCYSILLMNTAVPLIDRWTRPRIFGTGQKPQPEAAKA